MANGVQRSTYDETKHVFVAEAAEMTGFNRKYFSNKIAPAYRLQGYTNGRNLFYDRAALKSTVARIKRRLGENGHHKRGKLPEPIRKKVRSDFGTRRAKQRQMTQNEHLQPFTVEVVVSTALLDKLIRSGTIQPRIIVAD